MGGHHREALALEQAAIDHTHQHDHTHVGVEPAVDDHRAQRRLWIALGWRNVGHHGFENVFHAHARFGRAGNGVGRVDTDHILNLDLGVVRVCVGQVHLVEDRQDFHTQLQGRVAVGHGLRFHALAGVDHQQSAFARRERSTDLIREVDVAGGVDQVQVVDLPILGFVLEGRGLRLDGDAALFLDVHRVEHLLAHLAVRQTAAAGNDPIGQGGLAVVDVRDDRKIANVMHQKIRSARSCKTLRSNSKAIKKGASVCDAPRTNNQWQLR